MTMPVKALVALNVATLIAVMILGGFVALTVNDTNQKVATIAAALPSAGIASSTDVQNLAADDQATSQAISDLTAQMAALGTTLATIQAQLTTISGTDSAESSTASPAPDSTIGKLMAAVQTLQSTVSHIQSDVASVQGFVQSICRAIGRCPAQP